jgi:hypothetical protein
LPEPFLDEWFAVMCRVSSLRLSLKQFVSGSAAVWQFAVAAEK